MKRVTIAFSVSIVLIASAHAQSPQPSSPSEQNVSPGSRGSGVKTHPELRELPPELRDAQPLPLPNAREIRRNWPLEPSLPQDPSVVPPVQR